ncbi:TetR/AcrR family transcriptional regulator [Burkholderia sp. L27(2015)]|uniref:TetR/AcrR family transcriptional regulator n=1 Tax=Burkholderia sp. L27(2015) TaxID=1641858 RepID=UPI00131DB05D|nr:TetR/AcrR family transcriptional regulator [Burkholderia sp. L27(2015)]
MGRPREFDERQVLDAAIDAFLIKGYEATSTRDLVKCTGLTQPSLYNAFGDKRALFRHALDHYLEQTLRERISRLESSLQPGLAIAAFFGETVERALADKQQRGCLLVNSALEATFEDEEFRQAIASELIQIKDFFHRCLLEAHRRKEAPATLPADAVASHLLATLLGIRVLARVNPQRVLLTQAVSPVLTMLGLPPLPKPSWTRSALAAHNAI